MEKPNQKGDNSLEILESRGKKSKVKQLSRPRAATPEAASRVAWRHEAGAECSSGYRTKVKFNFWSPSPP